MVIVRLNDWGEFNTELDAHMPRDRVVRLTLSIRYDARGIAYLTMVAGFLNAENIVEFVHYLGIQPQDPRSERAEQIKVIFEDRKRFLEMKGVVVKPGRYHVPPTRH